jgi:hypothetical protein
MVSSTAAIPALDRRKATSPPSLPSATVSTLENAQMTKTRVPTAMSAPAVNNPVMEKLHARKERDLQHGLRPRYLRNNHWYDDGAVSPSAIDWTLYAPPIPPIPPSELANPVVARTIAENSDLFRINTPINVDRFEELLQAHPNRPFVDSVCHGLRNGFWPWADTHMGFYPDTHDASLPPPLDPTRTEFLRNQRDAEISKGRFSHAFGTNLLPGMYCMPIHVVPKPNSSDFRMVNDHSAGEFSLNSMIPRADGPTYPMDNLHFLGEVLLARHKESQEPLVLFKSDVAEAYRLIPMHPFWQIKQIVRIDGQLHADHNAVFGNRKSGDLWVSFFALVAWIACVVYLLPPLGIYVDDEYGPNDESDYLFYDPYQRFMPSNQTRLLCLWDELNIPHKDKKQVSGAPLVIIGIEVDPNALTFTLPEVSRKLLIEEIHKFCAHRRNKAGRRTGSPAFSVKRWQRLAGWLNWAFNVYPLLRPCLNRVYAKIGHKRNGDELIFTNNSIRTDLSWAADRIAASDGIHLVRSLSWAPATADVTIFTDACLSGMAFWYPELQSAFYAPTPSSGRPEQIFFYEALCVVSALQHAAKTCAAGARMVIYTDNANTVQMFSSLRALPHFNALLIFAVGIVLDLDLQLRVLHIPGSHNTIADLVSRERFFDARLVLPQLQISPFTPPPLRLGSEL